jgi:bifunctional DNA-binding transcriptional regulator/antitoxin component of YhaV-PrlF toxin-antitoxin module
MSYTALPSVKGQVTIPPTIRKKYHISKKTPLIIEDKGKGIITIRVMDMVDQDLVEYYENEKEKGLHFKKGIDPKILMDAIKKIDG